MRLDELYQALSEFNANRLDKATMLLDRRAAAGIPTSLDWMLRARIAEAQGRLADALDALKKIPDKDPVGAQAWLKAGQIELATRQSKAAEAAYLRSLTIDCDQVQPHRELAYLYAIQLRHDECDAQFRAIGRLAAMDHVLAFGWCQNYTRIWDPRAPRETLTGFITKDPTDRLSRLALATSFQLSAEYPRVETTLRPLPESDPDARAIRVQCAIERGQNEAAEELARAGPSDHPRINCLRGKLALLRNQPQLAAKYFRAAVEGLPEDRDANYGLGQALKRLDDPSAAKYVTFAAHHDQLMRMIKESPSSIRTDPHLFLKLGTLCQSLRRFEEARVWYQLAIKQDAFDSDSQQALARLEAEVAQRHGEPSDAR
jgi:tetratricopeptide (TPR) repeat protein